VLALAREQDDLTLVASTLSMSSATAWRWGDFEQAEKCCHESLELYRELGNQHKISQLLNILGILATLQENYEQAEQHYKQGLKIARETDERQIVADLLNNLGYLYHHSIGNLEKAKRCYQESSLIEKEIDHRGGATNTRINLGQLYILLGDHKIAWEYLLEALIESVAIGAVPLTLDALVGVVQLQTEVGQFIWAAEILGMVLSHPALEVDSNKQAELALDRLRKVVDSEQLEAAMERGKMVQLDAVVADLEVVSAETLERPVR
jgi:tetratricopeptide (TPR) repeat protein